MKQKKPNTTHEATYDQHLVAVAELLAAASLQLLSLPPSPPRALLTPLRLFHGRTDDDNISHLPPSRHTDHTVSRFPI
jgi:hypothetical protein